MPDCPKCGLPVADGEAFCNACGAKLPKIVKQSFCPVCGNTVLEGATRCNLCGTALGGGAASAAEELAKQQQAMQNPSMDAIDSIPIVTDDMLGLNDQGPRKEDMPTMDSVEMPGMKKPAPKPQPAPMPQSAPIPQPAPRPQGGPMNLSKPQAGAAPVIPEQSPMGGMNTPNVPPTPVVNDTFNQPQGGQFGQPNINQPPQGGQFGQPNFNQPPQGGQFGQPNFNQPPQGSQFGQPNFNQPPQGGQFGQPNFNQPPQGGQFGQPNFNQPPQGGQFGQQPQGIIAPDGSRMPANNFNTIPSGKPAKGGKAPKQSSGEGLSTVNKILIILIILVAIAAVLVFVVFKDKVFKGGSSKKSAASIVTMLDE